MTTTNRAVLKFNSDSSNIVRLSIPRADLNKTEAGATAAMQGIIDTGIITSDNGRPVSIHSAEVVSIHRTNIVPSV